MPNRKASTRKVQSSIEYISTFAIALLLLVVVIAVVAYLMYSNSNSTQTPSSCTITAQINCVQMAMASSSSSTDAFLVFTNQLGQQMKFSANSISFFPGSSNSNYTGTCLPSIAQPGATVICNATMPGYAPSVGSQQEPRFILHYDECTGGSCSTLSTVGTGTTYVSSTASLFKVQLVVSPSTAGTLYVDGAAYTSNSYVYLIKGKSYSVSISPSAGSAFNEWAVSGGLSLQSAASAATSLTATSNGILTADLSAQQLSSTPTVTCYALTLRISPSGASGTPTASSSAQGCPSGEYASGENIIVTAAAPNSGYMFSSWSGTASNTLTSFSVTMPSSAATETASYNSIQCYALTLSASPATSGAGSPTATTAVQQGCPGGEYAAGYNVTITANSVYTADLQGLPTYYVLQSWSGLNAITWAFNEYGYNTISTFNVIMPSNAAYEQANYLPIGGPSLFVTNAGSNTVSYLYTNTSGTGPYVTYWNSNGILAPAYYTNDQFSLNNYTVDPSIPASGPSAILNVGGIAFVVMNNAANSVSFITTYTVPNVITFSWHTSNVVKVGPDPVSIAFIPDLLNFNQSSTQVYSQPHNTAQYGSEGQLHCNAALPTCQFYVADYGSDTVTLIKPELVGGNTVYITNAITVGSAPIAVVPSQNGNFLFVANSGSGTVSVIDPSNNMVVNTIALGFNPISMGISTDGKDLYVQGSSSVGVISVPESCPLPVGVGFCQTTVGAQPYLRATYAVGSGQQAMAILPDNSKVYVAGSSGVQVINTATGAISPIGNVPSGASIAALTAVGNATVYMADSSQNEVLLTNTSTEQVVNAIAVGSDPTSLFPACMAMVAVANSGSGSIDIINTATDMVTGVATGLQDPGQIAQVGQPQSASSPVISPPYFVGPAYNMTNFGGVNVDGTSCAIG